MIPSNYFSLYFSDTDINFEHEIEVVEHDNNLELLESDIKDLPNHFLSKPEAETAKLGIVNLLRLTKKEPSPMRSIEEYILGNPHGHSHVPILVFFCFVSILLGCAIWMIQSDLALRLP